MRKTNLSRIEEVNYLADWCRTIIRFIYETPSLVGQLPSFLDSIERARAQGNLRGLREAYRDDIEMARDLSPARRAQLDAILKERFGHGLAHGDRKLERQAKAILKRGKIRKAEDYRILESWLEVLLDDPSQQETVDRISALLGSVEGVLPD